MNRRFTLSNHLQTGERLFGLSLADAVRRAASLAGGAIHISLENGGVVIQGAFGEILAESENHYAARIETEMFAAVDLGDIPTAKARAADLEKIRPLPASFPTSSPALPVSRTCPSPVSRISRASSGSGSP